MKDKYGLRYGDIQGLLDEAFGIAVSRGGAAQVVLRVAERQEPADEASQQIVRRSDVVYPDETGWPNKRFVFWWSTARSSAAIARPRADMPKKSSAVSLRPWPNTPWTRRRLSPA